MSTRALRACATYSCFFLSGAVALVYELLWVRSMSLFLGHSQWAISTVVASFMAGLALGGWAGGRAADAVARRRLPLLYALLELVIALYGLCFQPLTAAAQRAALSAGVMGGPQWFQAVVWFFAGFALVLVPAALMGATFPVFVRWLAGPRGELGRTPHFSPSGQSVGQAAGIVYSINTAGAVCGVFAAGYYLVAHLGMRASFQAAAAINLLCALLAFAVSRLPGEEEPAGPAPAPAAPGAGFRALTPERAAVYALLFISGYAALIAQLAWTRALALAIGSSAYAFTVILGVFLMGLSLGGGLAGVIFKKTRPGWSAVSIAALSAAAGIIWSLSVQNYLPFLLTRLYPFYFNSALPLPVIQVFLAMVSMLPPAVCMGFLFPALLGAGSPAGPAEGAPTGRYTAVNTLGAIIGSLAAGFALIPAIGSELTLGLAALFYLSAGVVALYLSAGPWRKPGLVLAPLLAAAALLASPKWDPGIMSSGAFMYLGKFRGSATPGDFRGRVRRLISSILMHKDGASATVTVFEDNFGRRFLRVNGKTDASDLKTDMSTQLLSAYLPRALFPGEPKNALIVGLGSGVTAGTLAAMPEIERVDCVEIEPEVARAAAFFSLANRRVLNRDNFSLIHADARHFLVGSKKTYDLIISEPSNLWVAGVASLYTKEAFTLAMDRLSGDGLFCQWLQGYSMSEADFRMALNTFASVFPDMLLLASSENDYLIIGSKRKIKADHKRVQAVLAAHPEMGRDLRALGLEHPFALLAAAFIFDDAAARAYAAGAPVHTDDRMALEFSTPGYLLKVPGRGVKESLRQAGTGLLPEHLSNFPPAGARLEDLYRLAGEAAAGVTGIYRAEPYFRKVLEASPGDPWALTGLARVEIASGNARKAVELFKKAMASKTPFAPAYSRLGELYLVLGEEASALAVLESGVKRFPRDPDLALARGQLYLDRAAAPAPAK